MIDSLMYFPQSFTGLKKVHVIAVPTQKEDITGAVRTTFQNENYKGFLTFIRVESSQLPMIDWICSFVRTLNITYLLCSVMTLLPLICFSIWPFPTTTQNTTRYFISSIDDFSRCAHVFLIVEKSNALDVFMIYKTEVDNQLEKIMVLKVWWCCDIVWLQKKIKYCWWLCISQSQWE